MTESRISPSEGTEKLGNLLSKIGIAMIVISFIVLILAALNLIPSMEGLLSVIFLMLFGGLFAIVGYRLVKGRFPPYEFPENWG